MGDQRFPCQMRIVRIMCFFVTKLVAFSGSVGSTQTENPKVPGSILDFDHFLPKRTCKSVVKEGLL